VARLISAPPESLEKPELLLSDGTQPAPESNPVVGGESQDLTIEWIDDGSFSDQDLQLDAI
jgi:hypothetical protein